MKKFILALACLTLLPTSTSFSEWTENDTKNALGVIGVGVTIGAVYYFYKRSKSTPTNPSIIIDNNTQQQPENLSPADNSGNTTEEPKPTNIVVPAENNKPSTPTPGKILVEKKEAPLSKPSILPKEQPNHTVPVAKKENPSFSSYCEKVSEIGWDY